MELGDIRSTLLQLMKIIANAEKSVFLSDEQKMYATLFHSKTMQAFSHPAFADNKVPMSNLKQMFFGFLDDRRFSSTIQVCKTFIKPHDAFWENDDVAIECESLDPYMSLNNKVKTEQEKANDKKEIDANDIQIMYASAFQCINDFLLSLNLVSEVLLQEEDTASSQSDSDLSIDEESDSSLGDVTSDSEQHSKNQPKGDTQNSQTNANNVKNSYYNATPNVIYKFKLLELDRLLTRFDDPTEIEKLKAEIKAVLLAHKKQIDDQQKSKIEVINEETIPSNTASKRIS